MQWLGKRSTPTADLGGEITVKGKQQPRTNGSGRPDRRPEDELDLQKEVLDSSSIDPLLEEENLGTGNYHDAEMWQQVESYRNGLYATAAFQRILSERAKEETKTKLALYGWELSDPETGRVYQWEGWEDMTPDRRRQIWSDEDELNQDPDDYDRRRWIRRRGESVLSSIYELRDKDRHFYPAVEALQELSGWEGDWSPAHYRMLMTRHEVSRSRGARLLDNFFGRVKEQIQDVNQTGGLRK